MSSIASAWAFDQQGLSPGKKLLLFLLAECHDACSGEVDSSIDWLAEHSNMSALEVSVLLESLRSDGLIGDGFALQIKQPRRVA